MTTVNVHINSPKNKIGLKFMRWAKKNFCLDKQCNNSSNFIISFYDKIILKELIFTLFLPSRRISREKVNSLTIKIFIFVWIFCQLKLNFYMGQNTRELFFLLDHKDFHFITSAVCVQSTQQIQFIIKTRPTTEKSWIKHERYTPTREFKWYQILLATCGW